MNFKPFQMSAVVATAMVASATLASAPAQAAILEGSTLNFVTPVGGGVNVSPDGLDFFGSNPGVFPQTTQAIGVVSGSGSFANLDLNTSNEFGTIKDLNLSSFVPIDNFISGLVGRNGPVPPVSNFVDISFDLLSITSTNANNTFVSFTGLLRRGTATIGAIGQFSTQTVGSNPSYSISITAIPTPALLPGLVAMGIGVIRKKKQQVEA